MTSPITQEQIKTMMMINKCLPFIVVSSLANIVVLALILLVLTKG